MTAEYGGASVDCRAWLCESLSLLFVVVPVTQASPTGLSYTKDASGLLLSERVRVRFPGLAASGEGLSLSGTRNNTCWCESVQFDGSEVSTRVVSTDGNGPYSMTLAFLVSR